MINWNSLLTLSLSNDNIAQEKHGDIIFWRKIGFDVNIQELVNFVLRSELSCKFFGSKYLLSNIWKFHFN